MWIDGRADIISGNYWIQCRGGRPAWPVRIRTWREETLGAMCGDLFGPAFEPVVSSRNVEGRVLVRKRDPAVVTRMYRGR